MATNLSLNAETPTANKTASRNPSCNYAPQCCWYETDSEKGQVCSNRNDLVCRKLHEEVFGQDEPTPRFGAADC
ncbi:MAG: hypothetical protein LBU12_09055 [Deltaproteobacteria bacterium]|jgi:hypothetical protein|nr:hypothetical protein [Deltaproteobacteria bacterium]